jgi:xanthine/CO dehydrogenase XdhC/CoxF family maturation factor
MLANAFRRLTLAQRIIAVLVFVILADFSIPAGCDCGDHSPRTVAISITGR